MNPLEQPPTGSKHPDRHPEKETPANLPVAVPVHIPSSDDRSVQGSKFTIGVSDKEKDAKIARVSGVIQKGVPVAINEEAESKSSGNMLQLTELLKNSEFAKDWKK